MTAPTAFALACEEPECVEDGDCKGRDVCEDGVCEDGPNASIEEAVAGFCDAARRCEPDSTPDDCEAQAQSHLESIEAAEDPDCDAYAQALMNAYACLDGSDCDDATACLRDSLDAQEAFEACDLSPAEGEGEGEGEGP